ncbi:MAG: rRNA pseudouridine synthase [Holosporaceae bacterium]|nr:rRNA pseudouridine synthase [Holosporaceae bacterium]
MTSAVRIAKKIAESGIASRREAEKLIETGRVAVDGEVVKTPVFFVTDQSKITIDGKEIGKKSKEIIIWKFHKPKGVITAKSDETNRRTVFDFFPNIAEHRLLYVGRLDYNSEGLLLFANNGDLARKLELPSTGLKRTYRGRIFGNLTEEKIRQLKNGVTVDGIKYGSVDVVVNADGGRANSWITATLSEGKNREIRKIMEYVGCIVNRLIRISYGPFTLGDLKPGDVVRASRKEIDNLLKIIQF